MKIYLSPHTDPETNLACEEFLRSNTREDYLVFYMNAPSVIIGRNQCEAAEADLGFCRRRGIKVVRRMSGGGAVYHDEGNVNYSFIRSGDSPLSGGKEDLSTMISILKLLGVDARTGERSELLLHGMKISGTASYCRGGRYVFHGTILYDTDLDTLQRALAGDKSLRGKKVASVPSPVTNIREYLHLETPADSFARSLTGAAATVTGGVIVEDVPGPDSYRR